MIPKMLVFYKMRLLSFVTTLVLVSSALGSSTYSVVGMTNEKEQNHEALYGLLGAHSGAFVVIATLEKVEVTGDSPAGAPWPSQVLTLGVLPIIKRTWSGLSVVLLATEKWTASVDYEDWKTTVKLKRNEDGVEFSRVRKSTVANPMLRVHGISPKEPGE